METINPNAPTSVTVPASEPGGNRVSSWWRNLRLRTRLIILVLAVSLPLLLISNGIAIFRSAQMILDATNNDLAQQNRAIFFKADTWIKLNSGILIETAKLPQIVSMDPAQQKIFLESTSKAFPHMYLVHTVDTVGFNVARSDNQPNKDYSTRAYVQEALAGADIAYQTVTGLTSNQPALVIGVPIKDASGKIVGVLASASELTVISEDLLQSNAETTDTQTLTFVVDKSGQVVAHPGSDSMLKIMSDYKEMKNYPPVKRIMEDKSAAGSFEFTDASGQNWFAYLRPMDNGWSIISQENSSDVFAPVVRFSLVSLFIFLAAAALLVSISYFLLNRSLRPIQYLTDTVVAVADGDLTRTAHVESRDEVGQLATAFNTMTEQLRQQMGSLEERVANRTRVIETSFEISRRISSILDFHKLVKEVVTQLQKAFNYYHVHVYLFDQAQAYLNMVGGTGEIGEALLARGHKIPAGKGLVGRAAESKQIVLVSNTQEEPGWLPNPLLPETRSEVAVPIVLGERVIGVLDVQENIVDGINQQDADLLKSIASQVAAAIQNAQTFEQSRGQAERERMLSTLGQKIQQASTVEEVLQVAVSELGQALNADRAVVELRSPEVTPKDQAGLR